MCPHLLLLPCTRRRRRYIFERKLTTQVRLAHTAVLTRGVHRQRVIFRILELAYRNLGSDLLTLLECYTVAGPATRARPVPLWHMPLQTAQTTVGLARGTMCARGSSRASDSNESNSSAPRALPQTSTRAASASSSICRPSWQPRRTRPVWPSRPINGASRRTTTAQFAPATPVSQVEAEDGLGSATLSNPPGVQLCPELRCRPHRGARSHCSVGEGRHKAAAGVTECARDGRPNAVRGERVPLKPAASSRRKRQLRASSHSKRSRTEV